MLEMDQEEKREEFRHDLDAEQARLAYSIISSLLEHTRVVSDLIAMMAQALDQDTTKALTQTPVWTAYLDSRRALERTKDDVESFTEVMKKLSDREQYDTTPPPPPPLLQKVECYRIIIITWRSRPPSNSHRKTPCHLPSNSFPSLNGIETDGPTMLALM
jgi:hypothetical protein